MPLFLWLDIVALSISTVLATALALMVLGVGPERILNRLFALFALTEACWAILSLLLSLALWLGKGDPLFISELATLFFSVMGPLLFLFTAHYVGLRRLWTHGVVALGMAIIVGLSFLLFDHQIVTNPRLEAYGSTVLDLSPLGVGLAGIPGLYIAWSLVLFWRERHRPAGLYLVLSVVILMIGFLVGGVLEVEFPVLSVTNTLSLLFLGHVVIGEQIFNPLRERTAELQREIVERARAEEALRESEGRFRAIFDSVNDALFVHDSSSGRILDVNRKACEMYGYSQEEMLQASVETLSSGISPYTQVDALERIEKATGGEPQVFEWRAKHKLGHQFWVEVNMRQAVISGAERVLVVVRDINERKRADEVQQRRAAQLAILNDVGKQIAAVLWLVGVLDRATHLILENFGYHHVAIFTVDHEQAKAVMKTRAGAFIDLFPPDHSLNLGQGMVGWVAQQGERLLANDVRNEPRYVNFYPDVFPTRSELDVPIRIGQEIAGVLNIQSSQTDDFDEDDIMVIETLAGQIAAAMENARLYESVQQELIERERAEDALRHYTVRLRTLREIDQAILAAETPQAIAQAALAHLQELMSCRRATVAMFDFKAGKVEILTGQADGGNHIGAGVSLEVSGLDPCLLKGEIAIINDLALPSHSSATESPVSGEGIRSCISVPLMFHDKLVGSLNLGSDEPGFFQQEQIEIASEVADQLGIAIQQAYLHEQIQQHATDLEERVAERTAELTAAYQELQALSHVKDTFVANVSHELRTPISSLKLYVQLLNMCPEKQAAYIESLEREADRLSDLIEGLLMLSRLDQDRIQMYLAPFDLNSLVKEYVADRRLLAETLKLVLLLELTEDMPAIKGDRGLLGQVLSALLTNAFNYTPEGGRVTVSTLRANDDQECGFCVADTGPGILPEERIYLFDRFYRGRAAHDSRTPGTGLGLAVAREIVDRHGGRIEVQSDGILGNGARFYVWLPAYPASGVE